MISLELPELIILAFYWMFSFIHILLSDTILKSHEEENNIIFPMTLRDLRRVYIINLFLLSSLNIAGFTILLLKL